LNLILIARGMDSPTINKNKGKMISEKPILSSVAAECSNHSGTPVSDQRSLTKIIRNMVRALNTSIVRMRWFSFGKIAFSILQLGYLYFILNNSGKDSKVYPFFSNVEISMSSCV